MKFDIETAGAICHIGEVSAQAFCSGPGFGPHIKPRYEREGY